MRKLITMMAMLALCSTYSYAKIWTVDQRPGANFTTLTSAISGATAGDTILIAGAVTQYAAATVSKKLTIIGPGYFLDENTNLQANTLSAKITSMTISSNAAGSVIMGLHFVGSLSISARNVTIARNRIEITTIYTDGISINNSIGNVTIMQNYITSSHANAYRAIYVGSSDSNIVIRNNFIESLSTGYGPIEASSVLVTSDVSNNVLYGVGSLTLHTASFNNNIIRSGSLTLTGVTPYNNICNSTQLAAYSSAPYSNQNSVSMTSVFVSSGTSDTKWQIATEGPADNNGFGGVDCGMYDNSVGTAYIPSGIPPIPSIYQFDASDLNNVTVKVKSHN